MNYDKIFTELEVGGLPVAASLERQGRLLADLERRLTVLEQQVAETLAVSQAVRRAAKRSTTEAANSHD